ncbi:MAG: wapA 1, partial [Bacillales bacterium]|nr:wapA 1 [Bacillales bacterium]
MSYEYDQNGNLKEVTTSRATKSFTYNSNNEVESSTYPVTEIKNMLTSYNYTADGDVDIITKQSGRQINYDYNEDNELSNIYYTKPYLPTKSWTYNYDLDKKLKSISNGEGTQSKIFNYNTEGELSQIIDRNVELGYDSDEATKTSNYFLNFTPNQYSTTHSTILNSENKVESILFTYGDAKQNKDTYTYSKNADGTSTETTNYGSSPDNTSSLFSSSRLLDKANKPKEIKYVKDGVEFDKWSYDYDLNGNIDKETRNGVLTEYRYDAINQLEKEIYSDGTELSYTYDEVGNRKTKVSTVNGVSTTEATFTYNLANQILTKNGFAYTYDDDGNLLKDENYDYVYDAAGRLADVKKHDGTLVASYDYDENGLRTKKTLGNIETEYYYSNNILTLESIKDTTLDRVLELHEFNYDKNGNVASMIQTLVAEDGSKTSNLYYYITNHRGDVVKMLDSNKNVVAEYSYDAFGNVLSQTGTLAETNPIRYAGYYYDSETKHYYLKARYYDPVNGNFQALDSVAGRKTNPISQNGFNYGNNNPVNNVDPNGKAAYWITASGGASKNGHTSLLLQDSRQRWWYFYWG